jgi:hypothetical protein
VKGCARTLLLQFAVFLAIGAGVMVLLHRYYGLPPGRTLGVSLGVAFCGWVGLALLFGIAQPVRERFWLRNCLAGRRPPDGKRTGIVGTIDAAGALIVSPLTGTDCVAWKYEISLTRGSGKNRRKSVFFEGIGLVPSVISTPSGSYRLFAVPAFDFGAEGVEMGTALRHWQEHIETARFEEKAAARRTLEKQWTDDDGAYRSEKRHVADDAPIEECDFREDLIRRGDAVYAVGLFSEARGGLVPHANWARETRIMKGDAPSVLKQLDARIVRYFIGGVLFSAAAAGIFLVFVSSTAK